ncbi:MAG: hypothetical protein IRY95_04135 [Clostridia bacterium]|nr:hypothetical protein [Clostridia bacterium]
MAMEADLLARYSPVERRSARRLLELYEQWEGGGGEPEPVRDFRFTHQGGCFVTDRSVVHLWRPVRRWYRQVLPRAGLRVVGLEKTAGISRLSLEAGGERMELPLIDARDAEELAGLLAGGY